MFDITRLKETPPFALKRHEKAALFESALHDLTRHHFDHCESYRRILDLLGYSAETACPIEQIPPLPVRLFKEFDLMSIESSAVSKTMTSSGTTGSEVSRIYLDAATASNQTQVLAKILTNFLGPKRLPLLIIDSKSVIRDRSQFSARAAGVLGFSFLGIDVTYALDDQMNLDLNVVESFLNRHHDQDLLLFGFTSIVWRNFYQELRRSERSFNLERATLIHGGGWKKLKEIEVAPEEFRRALREVSGIKRVHNYYGMVEQTGSILMECEAGFFHPSIYSDVVIRNSNLGVSPFHEVGLIELASLLPVSYPGHLILTEDLGEIVGEDDCSCGRMGKYLKIHGRLEKSEVRGCSDV